ncbi:hypothetical protein E2C01_011032 [Portunus trituberculatus]|uniref:Uncharacterized protein n=1 Tax=Portunus trituberculatus TaxID=210409 RepID=A0A5B7DAG6_PORTR|nr:hypothetical protein [Portunus trituberculatus]
MKNGCVGPSRNTPAILKGSITTWRFPPTVFLPPPAIINQAYEEPPVTPPRLPQLGWQDWRG